MTASVPIDSLLFVAALFGGALNSVAGGGSFLALPALLYAGVRPVTANATTTFALWSASLSSALAYRREIVAQGRSLVLLGAASIAGGLIGGFLLMRTSDTGFMRLLPWLMLLAAATLSVGGDLATALRRTRPPARDGFSTGALLLQFAIATYGGYFAGGIGIMMLATLSMAGMTDIHQMNGLKSVLTAVINGVALAEFVALGAIAWAPGLVMVAGGILGGYAGASLARRIEQRYVRSFAIVTAWSMTTYFFLR